MTVSDTPCINAELFFFFIVNVDHSHTDWLSLYGHLKRPYPPAV